MNMLKACPFCGADAMVLVERTAIYYVWCKGCHVTTERFTSESEAVNAWNARHINRCEITEWGSLPNEPHLDSAADMWTLSCGHIAIGDFEDPPQFCPKCGAFVENAYVDDLEAWLKKQAQKLNGGKDD